MTDKVKPRKCTVFPFHPLEHKDSKRIGVVLWVPQSIEELIREASEQLNITAAASSCILSEDAGRIIDVDMISEGQKLYLMSETQ